MIYRSAPLQNSLSPAQRLMGRSLRTNLPVMEELLTPKFAFKIKADKERGKQKLKQQYNESVKELPVLRPRDQVRVWDQLTSTWSIQGHVQREVAPRSYQVQTEDGLSRRRNPVDLRPPEPEQNNMYDLCPCESNQTMDTPESSPKQVEAHDNQQLSLTQSHSDVAGTGVTASAVPEVSSSPAVPGISSRPKRTVKKPD